MSRQTAYPPVRRRLVLVAFLSTIMLLLLSVPGLQMGMVQAGPALPPLTAYQAPSLGIVSPSGLVIDGQGNLYVADSETSRIHKLSPQGEPLATIGGIPLILMGGGTEGPGRFFGPRGLALDSDGNLYVVDSGNNRIQKLSPAGEPLAQWGTAGSGPGQFGWPSGVAVDRDGNLFVADSGNNRIQKLSPVGEPLAQWGTQGSGPGQFQRPEGVALDTQGNLYVADRGNVRIQKLSAAGEPLAQWGSDGAGPGQFKLPMSVAVDGPGNIYVADMESHRIQKFAPTGAPVAQWGSEGAGPGQFSKPVSVALDAAGNVYVADSGTGSVQKLSPEGAPLAQWGHIEPVWTVLPGAFQGVNALVVDDDDHLLVADSANHRIVKLTSDGTPLTQWGSEGTGEGQFLGALDVTLDAQGNLFVSDAANGRIQKLSPQGEFLAQWNVKGAQGPYRISIAVDAQGNLYVMQFLGVPRQKLSPSGEFLGTFAVGVSRSSDVTLDKYGNVYVVDDSPGPYVVKLSADGVRLAEWGSACERCDIRITKSVTVDREDNVFVSERDGILKLAPSGGRLGRWGTFGGGPGLFRFPRDIAVDHQGNIYVADSGNNRIQKLPVAETARGR